MSIRPSWSVRLAVDPEYATLRHVGNLEFSRLFHEARLNFNAYLKSRMSGGGQHFSNQMIVHISLDFAREIFWIPEIEVYVRIGYIGHSSYELDLSIWDVDTVAVRSKTVNVMMEDEVPTPIVKEARTLLISCQ